MRYNVYTTGYHDSTIALLEKANVPASELASVLAFAFPVKPDGSPDHTACAAIVLPHYGTNSPPVEINSRTLLARGI